MWSNIFVGVVMMLITIVIHAAFMVLSIRLVAAPKRRPHRRETLNRLVVVGSTVLVMFGASLVEISAYALAYVVLGAISSVEPALYFSTVTFTTLGYGDVVLDPRWRLLASFEAANGIIMFGWTTAMVVAAVRQVYSPARR